MNSTVFKEASNIEDIFKFFDEKDMLEQPDFSDLFEDLTGIQHKFFEISSDGDVVFVSLYYDNEELKHFEREFMGNIYVNYLIFVKNDFSEFRFIKYDEGTGKTLRLRKKIEDMNAVFLNKLESLQYDNFDTFEKIFDRSEFIKEFYQLYCDAEEYLISNITGIPNEEEKELFAKLIIQRIMFLWFLQKKGFLDDNENYFVDKFKSVHDSDGNFYSDFLRFLFFDGLCKEKTKREATIKKLIGDVPYLNGGLFLESETELKYQNSIIIKNLAFYKSIDNNSLTNESRIPVLNLMGSREWTIDERSGEVDKLNPEVLGYIFEKSINKKDLGAVYTPEEITTHICKNTVYPYIIEKLNKKYQFNFKFSGNIVNDVLDNLNRDQLKYLSKIIKDIKILDPAIGSGHFVVDAIITLEQLYKYLREKEILGYSDFDIREFIITENIFGVDILPGAVEICKLRLFLALAETFRTKDDIKPLPNIEFNIRCGNSLIGIFNKSELNNKFFSDGPAINALSNNMTFFRNYAPNIADMAENILSSFDVDPTELFRLRNELVKYYKDLHKHKLQTQFRTVLYEITEAFNVELNNQLYEKFLSVFSTDSILRKLKDKDRIEHLLDLKPFHWVMEYSEVLEQGGFDVILGNPPYINNRKINKNEKPFLKKEFVSAYKLYDYAVLFIEQSYRLLIPNGFFSFIVTNKFVATDYGIKIREYLIKNTTLNEILDVSNYPVFVDIGAYPIIINFKKSTSKGENIIYISPNIKSSNDFRKINKFKRPIKQITYRKTPDYIFDISGNAEICDFIRNTNVIYVPDLEASWFYRPLGFTGWNKLLEYVNNDQGNESLKFIGAGNLRRYRIIWDKELRLGGKRFRKTYIHYDRSFDKTVWEKYKIPQILVKEVSHYLTAAYSDGSFAHLTGMYGLIYDYKDYSLNYLLVIFNSRLLNFYYRSLYGTVHMAGGDLNFHASYLNKIPIFKINNSEQDLFNILGNVMLFLYSMDDPSKIDLIEQISTLTDYLIYEMYFNDKFIDDLGYIGLKEDIKNLIFDITKNSDEEYLKNIETFLLMIKGSIKIQKEIKKIGSHPWIKEIEKQKFIIE